jgi:hypothetical protein
MASQKGTLLQPTFAFPMVSVCVLVGAFLVYYFPITARQEASLNRRAFRSLAAVSDSLVSRVANYVQVLEQGSKPNGAATGSKDFAVETGTPNGCRANGNVTARAVAGTAGLQIACGDWSGTLAMDRILPPYLRGTPGQIFDDILLTDSDGTVMYQSIATGSRINSIRSAVLAAVPGATTAEQKPATPGAAAASALGFATASQSSTLVSTVIAGEEYRLYVVPVPLRVRPSTAPVATPTAAPPPHLIVAGLMRASRFRADSMALPGPALITAIVLVLVVMVATWPLLKFATMSATDRIPRRSAVYLFLTTLATIILVSILAIHLRYTVNLGHVDRGLERLAASIESNLTSELKVALRVLESVSGSPKLQPLLAPPLASACPGALSDENRTAHVERQLLARVGVRLSDYPYFDRIFWVDSAGHQHIKWEAGRATSPTYVGDRDYFVETAANRLWQFADAAPGAARFRVDPILSRNTGEYRAVITQPAPPVPICGSVKLSIVAMVTPLLSLIDPILPPDHGFAVVNGDGLVLFHSTGTKNGDERFLDEVEKPAELRSALFARQGKLLTARYLGLDHRLFVTPLTTLNDNPWSLIVFHDLAAGAAQHFERIVLFAVLALIYFVVLAVALMVAPATRGPRDWAWPREENRGAYLHLTLTLLLVAPPLYLLMFATSRPATVLLVAALIPALALAMGALKVRPVHRLLPTAACVALFTTLVGIVATEPQSKGYLSALAVGILAPVGLLCVPRFSERLARPRWPSLTASYASVWAATLAVVAVLPCIGFFRVAYDYHGNLSTRRQQVQTMAALAGREERVKAEYSTRELTLDAGEADADVARWLFVRRRLEETLDRYDAVLLNPDSGQLFSANTALRPAARDDCDDGLSPYVRALATLDPSGDAANARTLTAPVSGRSIWSWCREGSNRLRLSSRTVLAAANRDAMSLPPTRALLKSVNGDPIFLHGELLSELPVLEAWWLPVPMFALLATAGLTYLWVKPTIRHMFLLDVPGVDPLPAMVLDRHMDLSRNLILLTLEPARLRETLKDRRDLWFIDVAGVLSGKEGADAELQPVEEFERTFVLVHFDYWRESFEANAIKLELLERLAMRYPKSPVVIVSGSDPDYFAGGGFDRSGRSMERWPVALGGFPRVRILDWSESTPDVARRAWVSCTTAERIALHQLAHDAWVNPKNGEALHQLQRRGLVGGRPLRIVDPALEAFVAHSVDAREQQAWSKNDTSAWDGIRLMFVVVLLGVLGAALFYSQQSVLGLVATGVGVLTPLTKLLSEANSFRSLLGFGKAAK